MYSYTRKKIIYRYIIIVIAILSMVIMALSSYVNNENKNLSNGLVRLHIVANSDEDFDQDLKLKVRDEILKFMKNNDFVNKKQVVDYFNSNMNNIIEIANKEINRTTIRKRENSTCW